MDFTAYDHERNFDLKAVRSLCYAPHTNLFFDRLGSVRVCCWNWSQAAGNIAKNSLDEIWHGAQAAQLRATLEGYHFAEGCEFCKFQAAEGWFGGAKMRNFDRFDVVSPAPQWPQQMEFSISNACNLECIMCDGEHSSMIRAVREKRPAMARLYTDEILESFRKYLPHLRQAKFLGGEPFLIAEHYKIWQMMVEDRLQTLCHVTTNGTQYNNRIEQVLSQLPFGFAISLDGVTKQTIERIRVNTNYEELMRNTEQFRKYARTRRTPFSLTYCLMRPNWHELGEFCLMADQWNCHVGINTVLNPLSVSLYALPVEELRTVLQGMERQAVSLESQLKLNKSVWFNEFERIRRKCAAPNVDATPASAPSAPKPRATAPRNAFVMALTGEREIDQATPALHFLKKFSKSEIIVVQSRTERRAIHDQVINITLPPGLDDITANAFIKTEVAEHVAGLAHQFCYLDASVVSLNQDIDEIFAQPNPGVSFQRTEQTIDSASRFAVNCRCGEPQCNHLREAIFCNLGTDIPRCDWPVWDSRVFLFNTDARPFFQAWQTALRKVEKDKYWSNPLQGALFATAWRLGLAEQKGIRDGYVRLETVARHSRASFS